MNEKIDMVMINKDNVTKKQFEVINQDNVISFNLGNFTLAMKVSDLKKFL